MHPEDQAAPLWSVLFGFVLVEGGIIWITAVVLFEIFQLLVAAFTDGAYVVLSWNMCFVLSFMLFLLPCFRELWRPGAVDEYIDFLRSMHDGMIRAAFN
uniref:Orf8 n=1 Tax=229E-related bat coronavirus TaxID=1739614 RepID=A0A0P0K6N3_CVH22|nr:orf8 [229E-related bat coronavirus]